MINVEEIKRLIETNRIEEKIPAGIYSRVSTKNESQKDSCENQVKTAKEFVEAHVNISLTDDKIFVDDGISGKSVTKREEYKRMMKAVNNDEIKLIIVKTNSRLFRSVNEATIFMQTLIKHNVTLYTLSDNKIWDFTNHSDELMFTFESVINAATSRTQHDAGVNAQERRVRDKELKPRDIVPGFMWDKEKKDIVPDPSCEKYIVEIFEEYAYRNGSPLSISEKFEKEGKTFPIHKRDKITRESHIEQKKINSDDISRIIKNRKYIGEFKVNVIKSIYVPGEESQRVKVDPEEQVVISRPDLAIVEKELFDLVQRIHNAKITHQIKHGRIITREDYKGKYKFSAKIYCSVCGKPFQYGFTDRKQMFPLYRIKKHSACSSNVKKIYEADLEEITKKAIKQVMDQQKEVYTIIEQVLTEAVKASHNSDDEINYLKKQKGDKQKEIDNLTDAIGKGYLNESAIDKFLNRINKITEEIEKLEEEISEKTYNQLDDDYVPKKIASIKSSIDNLKNFSVIDRKRVLNYIDRIKVLSNGNIEIILNSEDKTGKKICINNNLDKINNVGKLSERDALFGPNTNINNNLFLCSFKYSMSINTRSLGTEVKEVTVNVYLKTY